MITTAQAVLFDLDGVLTDTAAVHMRAWHGMWTDFMLNQDGPGQGLAPYTQSDYYRFIDGKPRFEGVEAFLESRGCPLPVGFPDDELDAMTVCGLANHKNARFLAAVRDDGVRAFDGSFAALELLHRCRVPVGLVSSSQNAVEVLAAAGLAPMFELVVDGVVAKREGLAGKPSPQTYLYAAAALNAVPACTVVVEDAVSGVAAGCAGGFRVVGVDRGVGRAALRRAGADVVVDDLCELLAI